MTLLVNRRCTAVAMGPVAGRGASAGTSCPYRVYVRTINEAAVNIDGRPKGHGSYRP